jgi:hypothetical protein
MKALGYAIATTTILMALYVGAYCALVERTVLGAYENREGRLMANACYRWGSDVARVVFEPINVVDQHIRSNFWELHVSDFTMTNEEK